jgi:hypothetical protein
VMVFPPTVWFRCWWYCLSGSSTSKPF